MTRTFVDTNVLVYAEDPRDSGKRARAREIIDELWSTRDLVVSTQILQELYISATRKLRLAAAFARSLVEDYGKCEVILVRPDIVLAAIDLHRLNGLSFWDALVVKCASVAGCTRVLTEDFQHGRTIEGVRIENPFLPASRAGERASRYRSSRRRPSASAAARR